MKKFSAAAVGFLAGGVLLVSSGCHKDNTTKAISNFNQVNLTGNNNEYHNPVVDTSLINAWGLAFSPTGTAWVASPGGHVSTIYDKEGNMIHAPVAVPSPGGPEGGNPTGIVYNGTNDFVLSNGQPAKFLFVGVDGILSGWNPAAGNSALLIKNNVTTSAYTGLAVATMNGSNFLYAANFRTRKIDVWDSRFTGVRVSFKDPSLPEGYAPYNIQLVGQWLYVAYAKVGPDGRDLPGAGNGYVSIFSTAGDFLKRFASGETLNAPWGITTAPASFFDNTGDDYNPKESITAAVNSQFTRNTASMLLVGNFGDGKINVFTEEGKFAGQLKAHGQTIAIPGLWALGFPPATATAIDPNRLYFTAGPDNEKDGLFGYLEKK